MKKTKLTRFYIWSGLSKLQNISFMKDEDELDEIEKHVLQIFKSSIKNPNCILLHYKREFDNVFELHNRQDNFLIRMNVKDNGSIVELLEFPSSYTRTKRTSVEFFRLVTERLKASFENEIMSRSDILYTKFTQIESKELKLLASNIEILNTLELDTIKLNLITENE